MPRGQRPPNVLFVVTDQQRFDTIGALGNEQIATPNIDRLWRRGMAFENAYSLTPVCVPARYTMYSGLGAMKSQIYSNEISPDAHRVIRERFGPYLAERMDALGYRTFGVGKFHTTPWDAPLGFEVHLHSEEFYLSPDQRARDSYAAWIRREHAELDWIEALMGERAEMYYMPQMSPLPAALTVESWATDEAIRQIVAPRPGPWFGFVSYIGPHPPFAPPIPYNRMYDPDTIPGPEASDAAVDFLDQQIPWMNYAVYAETVDPLRARVLKARYFGEISYIDSCIGRLLDAIESGPDSENTMICFCSDHGDLLGDHNGWQKENYFEAATRVPLLVSWPGRIIPGGSQRSLVCLEDLFGLATGVGGAYEPRDGVDLLALARGSAAEEREDLVGVYGEPGTERFKAMVRHGDHKLIWLANGGIVLLFDLAADPGEHRPIDYGDDLAEQLIGRVADVVRREEIGEALDGSRLRTFPYKTWPRERIQQFDRSRGVSGFGVQRRGLG